MADKFSETFTIDYGASTVASEWRLDSLLAMLTTVSVDHNKKLDARLGTDFSSLLWVIVQHDVTIERWPKMGEKVEITTEPWGYNHFFCFRRYVVKDEAGDVCVQVETAFAVMDWEARKMSRVPEALPEAYGSDYAKRGMKRIHFAPEPETDETTAQRVVTYADLDVNQHAGNAAYGRWLMDQLGLDFQQTHRCRHFTIKYEKELRYHQPFFVAQTQPLELADTGRVAITHYIADDTTTYAKVYSEWEPREQ